MKYVTVAVQKDEQIYEFPIIFPETLVHKDVALYISTMLKNMFEVDAKFVGVTSAGFLPSTAIDGKCASGESKSLKIKSVPSDGDFIKCNDYCANIRDNAAAVASIVELETLKRALGETNGKV